MRGCGAWPGAGMIARGEAAGATPDPVGAIVGTMGVDAVASCTGPHEAIRGRSAGCGRGRGSVNHAA